MLSNVTVAGLLSGSKQMLKKWGLLRKPSGRYGRWGLLREPPRRYGRPPKSLNLIGIDTIGKSTSLYRTITYRVISNLKNAGLLKIIAGGLILPFIGYSGRYYWFEHDDSYDFEKPKKGKYWA